LSLSCDPNETDKRGVTLLADAAGTGDVQRVTTLLEAGADPDVADVACNVAMPMQGSSPFDDTGYFSFQIPLHNGTEVDEVEIVNSLIYAGADVHVIDRSRRTALFLARSTGS
jgi:ankyrin repeat protein